MSSTSWTEAEITELRSLVEKRLSFADIASKMSRTPGAVAKKAQSLGLRKPTHRLWSSDEQRAAMVLSYDQFRSVYPDRTYHAYFGQRRTLAVDINGLDLIDYTRLVEEVVGDAVIAACVHVPTTDPTMWSRALAIGERDGIANFIIAGDIVTGDMFSKWETKENWDFDRELESLQSHLEQALAVFENVYITPGNHVSNRIVRVTNGHIRLRHLIDMCGFRDADRERIFTTDIDFLRLRSGSEKFLVGHATNYSVIDGKVAVTYAEKEECHVITGNGHRFGQQTSKSGRWMAWELGTLADTRYMGYVNRALTRYPKMMQSFITVRNGVVKTYAAAPPMTDWLAELGPSAGSPGKDGGRRAAAVSGGKKR